MKDITIVYLTASEIPEKFAEWQRKLVTKAANGSPIISLSMKPLDFGFNILQDRPKSISNIYYQLLRGLRYVETPYFAVAEDDTLYSRDHFTFCRPPDDTFAYNMTRWALFTWGTPTFSWRMRISNSSLIGPTKLAIEALEERFAKYPNGTPDNMTGELGKPRLDKALRLTPRNKLEVFARIPIIQMNHDWATEEYQRRHIKRMGAIQAFDIPHWGKAEDIVKRFNQ